MGRGVRADAIQSRLAPTPWSPGFPFDRESDDKITERSDVGLAVQLRTPLRAF